MKKRLVKLAAVGLIASTCITGCGYQVSVTKKEPVEVSEEKDAGKSKDDDAEEETKKSKKETEEADEEIEEAVEKDASDDEEASEDEDASEDEAEEKKESKKGSSKASADKVQLEGVAISNYKLVDVSDSDGYTFVEGDIKNSDVVIGFNSQTFDADSDEAVTYKLMFNSTFDESVMERFQDSAVTGSTSMEMKLDNSILEGTNVIMMNTSTDVSMIMWGDQGEHSDKYHLLVAVFVGPGANDKDNIKEFISNVDVNGKSMDIGEVEFMTVEEFSEINTKFGDFDEYAQKLKESLTGQTGSSLEGFEEEMDETESSDIEASETEVSGDLKEKALAQDWYKDFGVIHEDVYVGFSTKDDFEKVTGATPIKTIDSGNSSLWYYNHSGCDSFYLVVDDETGRIKSASYGMKFDSRPAASDVKSNYGTPDTDNGYFKYVVEGDDFNSISAIFYTIDDKVTQIEVSSIIIN